MLTRAGCVEFVDARLQMHRAPCARRRFHKKVRFPPTHGEFIALSGYRGTEEIGFRRRFYCQVKLLIGNVIARLPSWKKLASITTRLAFFADAMNLFAGCMNNAVEL